MLIVDLRDFLTGFRKRKQERKKKAKEKYDERIRQEKIKDRAILRAERRREVEDKMAALQAMIKGFYKSQLCKEWCNNALFYSGEHPSDDEEEITLFGKDDAESQDDSKEKQPSITEFKSNTALTTVTVIEEMDDWGKDI